jgi:hypothetical protein
MEHPTGLCCHWKNSTVALRSAALENVKEVVVSEKS